MSSRNDWSWPPKENVIKFAAEVGNLDTQNIKQCFSLKGVPKVAKPCKGEESPWPVAAHCFIFARIDDSNSLVEVLGNIDRKAAVMMQMRFDGAIGFPGGEIDDEDSSVLQGLNRELHEEMALDLDRFRVKDEDFVCCLYVPHDEVEDRAVTLRYLYVKEVTLAEYEEIEAASLKSSDYGTEVLGNVRVPIHVYGKTGGLPKFLRNQFPGSAVIVQLFWGIYMKKLLTLEELDYSYGSFRQSELNKIVI